MINQNSTKSIIPLSFLLISILFHSASADFVTDTCQKTSIPQLCESILRSDPRSAQANTVNDLAKYSFDMGILNAINANRQATDLARQYRGQPEEHPLAECADVYLAMNDNLHEGETALNNQIYGKANDLALSAQGKPDECEKQFKDKNMPSLLADTDATLTNKANVCLALTKLLVPGGVANSNRKLGN